MTRFTRAEIFVGLFTIAYVLAFSVYFLSARNYEFVFYILTMLILIVLIGWSARKAEFPPAMLWALSIWGLAHMAGGGVQIGGSVLYNLRLVPLVDSGEIFILKYDQVVHAYGFGVSAWVLQHVLLQHFPQVRGTATSYVYPALAAMGLGAVNEIIEFSAVVMVPDTNVGGYTNTALDLVFNAGGAVIAMLISRYFARRSEKP